MSSLSNLFDAYSLKARLFPAWLAIMPLHGVLLVLLPDVEGVILAIVAPPPMAILIATVARNLGKRVEADLWINAGGNPVVRFLRLSDSTLSTVVKESYHSAAEDLLSHPMPSIEEEKNDPNGADELYGLVGHKLRIRDHSLGNKKDTLLFKRNIEYGFSRNCFGLRWVATGIALLSLFLVLFSAIDQLAQGNISALLQLPILNLVLAIFNVVLIMVWLFVVTEKYVAQASDAYAMRLLELLESFD